MASPVHQIRPYLAPFQLLELNIISAQELRPVSRNMKTYAVAWVHPDRKLSTRIDPHGHTNPTWNDKFVFRVDDEFLQNDLSAMMIEIYASHWWRDILVGTVRVLVGNLIPRPSSIGRHQLGMTFVALQVRRRSGRPQGILNIGVGLLDSSMRSMPLYSQLSSSAVGYRDLIGENETVHHHQNKTQFVQNYHQQEGLVQRPELRRTRSDTSSMVFDQPTRVKETVDSNAKQTKHVKRKKGKASSWVSGSTSEFGDPKKMRKKKASSMISGESGKESYEEKKKNSEGNGDDKQAPTLSQIPSLNAVPPKGIIFKQLRREPSMKRVTIGEPVIVKESVVEKLKEPETKLSSQQQETNGNNQESKAADKKNDYQEVEEKQQPSVAKRISKFEEKMNKKGGIAKPAETHKNQVAKENKEGYIAKPTKIDSPPSGTPALPPPPPPKNTPLPPPIYTPLSKLDGMYKKQSPIEKVDTTDKKQSAFQKLDVTDKKQSPSKKLDVMDKKQSPYDTNMMYLKPYNITDSELGPSPSEVAAAVALKAQHYKGHEDKASSVAGGWSLDSSVEGLQSKLDRWRTELPPVYDRSEFTSYTMSDDVTVKLKSSTKQKRRQRDNEQEGAVSCFSSICGIQCSIVCGTASRPVRKKGQSGKARGTPVAADSVLFI